MRPSPMGIVIVSERIWIVPIRVLAQNYKILKETMAGALKSLDLQRS